MSHKISVIKCQKCGYMSNIISDTCIKCGSLLEKICGDCGFSNAVEKNHCDQCHMPLLLRAAQPENQDSGPASPSAALTEADKSPKKPKFKFEMQPISETVAEKEASFRNRLADNSAPAALKSPAAPQSPAPSQSPAAPPLQPAPAPAPSPKAQPATQQLDKLRITSRFLPASTTRFLAARNISDVAVTIGLLAVLMFFLYLIAAPHIPRFTLKLAANRYLKRLSTGRYEEAYAMLSTNSKAACPLKSFVDYNMDYYGKSPSWTFKDVKVFDMQPNAAMMSYQLKTGTEPWRTDYISFVKEHDRWTRPYIWMLLEPIDAAIAKQDYPQTLFLAQRLYLTDPMDPRSFGYLCAAEFFMGLYDKAADSCRKTLLSASVYPVGFSAVEILQFRFFYADSLRFVQKFELALNEYSELLGSETTPPQEQCPLFLSRADTYVKLKRYDAALNDMLKADGVCGDGANRADVTKRMKFMNGEARADAISFAQRTKLRADLPTFTEMRNKELAAMTARQGGGKQRDMPKDRWVAAHLAGPEYRVVLRQESFNTRTHQKDFKNIYVFTVNLWTGVIRLEEAAPIPKQGDVQRK